MLLVCQEDILTSEQASVVLPLTRIVVDRPSFAYLGNAKSCEYLFGRSVNVGIGLWLGLLLCYDVRHVCDQCVNLSIEIAIRRTRGDNCTLEGAVKDVATEHLLVIHGSI